MEWWRRENPRMGWAEALDRDNSEAASTLRRCTYAGRPFGDEHFVDEISRRFGRYWTRGRPKKQRPQLSEAAPAQLSFFAE